VKALLEPPELILREEIRRRIPFAKMKNVGADGDWLRFTFEGEPVAVQLGDGMAAKCADAMLKPPPTLAKKLGITPETTVRTIGPMDDAALKAALEVAAAVSNSKGDLILARVDTPADLNAALAKAASETKSGIPIWFIYRKGDDVAANEAIVKAAGDAGHAAGVPLAVHATELVVAKNGNLVRETALATVIVNTKIASVSAEFSALRFLKRRN
jgi:hypothetical protein